MLIKLFLIIVCCFLLLVFHGLTDGQAVSPSTTAQYCHQFNYHYAYHCVTGGARNPQSVPFCDAYKQHCDESGTPKANSGANTGTLNQQQINEECNKQKSVAGTYCTGQNEPPSVKTQCDEYRRYCLNNNNNQARNTQKESKSSQKGNTNQKYCNQNKGAYHRKCEPKGRKRRQSDPMATAQAHGFTPEKINAMCNQYQNLAEQYCTGNEPAGQIRQRCDLYRTYCLHQAPPSNGAQQPQPQPQQATIAPQNVQFCDDYVQKCY